VKDPHEPVVGYGLGLVDVDVYGGMCSSKWNQVHRICSVNGDGHSLLAAVLRAQEFDVETGYEPPPLARVAELRESIQGSAAALSDEELSASVSEYDCKVTTKEQFLESSQTWSDMTFIGLYQALHPTAPQIYIIIEDLSGDASLTLDVIRSSDTNRPCVVLFQQKSCELPFVEVIGWKRGARGTSPIKTVFDSSESIIQSLEAWLQQHTSSKQSRKRGRDNEGDVED
jgi:hypothetical protein